jgi:hypothetical protein
MRKLTTSVIGQPQEKRDPRKIEEIEEIEAI